MLRISKKFLSVLLAVIISLSAFVTIASANPVLGGSFTDLFVPKGEVTVDNIIYECYIGQDFSRAEIKSYVTDGNGNPLLPESVVIPETVVFNGTEIAVTSIQANAFMNCSVLKEITLPASIKSVDDQAFKDAVNLEKVIIPETAEFSHFGEEVFEGTKAMDYFIDNSEDGAVIFGKNIFFRYFGTADTYVMPEDIDTLFDGCFENAVCKEIILSEKMSYIPDNCFRNCKNLKEITIPDSVARVNDGAFSGCEKLEKVNLGDKLVSLGFGVFEGTNIKDIYLGEDVLAVNGAFSGCDTLENITVNENNKHYAFEDDVLYYISSYTKTKEIELFLASSDKKTFCVPEDVTGISSYAFNNCKNLEEICVNIEKLNFAYGGLKVQMLSMAEAFTIGEGAFKGCENLRRADLTSVYVIEDSAFEDCVNLKDVTFNCNGCRFGARSFANTGFENIVIKGYFIELGKEMFADCLNLKSVEFKENVEEIPADIVANCPSLERVFVSRTVSAVDEDAFSGCGNVKFELVKNSTCADIMVGYAEDPENDVTTYEFVGRTTVFDKMTDFAMYASKRLYVFFFGCQGIFTKLEQLFKFGYIPK